MSPAGVNNISPPNDGGWVSSPSTVSIACSKSPGFLTLSSASLSMATNDHGRNWCMDHSHGERGSSVWHDSCAQVRACQMSGWLRRHSNVLPTLSQVNAQRVLWQKRCDRLLDHRLCNHCLDEKDDAFARGQGLDWIPDNCNECSTVRRIF